MERFAALTGRRYRLFDYVGDPGAERLIVIMGSGAETVDETVQYLTEQERKLASSRSGLFRPFSGAACSRRCRPATPLHRRSRSDEGARGRRRSALS